MNCLNLKKKQKQYNSYLYCTIKRSKIEYSDCSNCPNRVRKTRKPIKRVSKKRVTVSKSTYNAVLDRDKRCRLCGCINNLQLHHILYRSERKDLINEVNNCIMLCDACHRRAHSNKKKYQPLLQELVR